MRCVSFAHSQLTTARNLYMFVCVFYFIYLAKQISGKFYGQQECKLHPCSLQKYKTNSINERKVLMLTFIILLSKFQKSIKQRKWL